MILSELKEYIREHKVVSLHDIVMHFDVDPNTLRGMVDVWIRKGKVRRVTNLETKCNKCAQCNSLSNEIYEWIGDAS